MRDGRRGKLTESLTDRRTTSVRHRSTRPLITDGETKLPVAPRGPVDPVSPAAKHQIAFSVPMETAQFNMSVSN